MRHSAVVSLALALACISPTFLAADTTSGWPVFKGAWFSIKYPPGFTARPSLPSCTSTEGYDSVFFRSPDEAVEFYIFSPQWSGEPSDILIDRDREVCLSWSCEQKPSAPGKKLIWVELQARDQSYRRAYVDIREGDNLRHVFGIKYKDQAAYNRYRSRYLAFKSSLQQFAD